MVNNKLFFRQDGSFKCIQFTDIHYTNDDEADLKSVQMIEKIIQEEKPDFIVITGDTVYGEQNLLYIHKALKPVTDSKVPWTFVFGNHDVEFNSNREELFEIVKNMPGCMAYNSDPAIDGMGNHIIEVRNKEEQIRFIICGIDSLDYCNIPHVGGYGYLSDSQIKWYDNQIKKYKEEYKEFSSLIFMHMAIPEFHEVWAMETCYGEKNEGICCPRINSGFFASIVKDGHTKGLFVGHDHINDFYGDLYGVILGYGRASGFGTYGKDGYKRGARVFVLQEDNIDNFDTYLHLDGGIIVKQQDVHKPTETRDE